MKMTEEKHIPVLLEEAVKMLDLKPGDDVVDCNLGYGGHAAKLLEATAPQGKLIGIDLDPLAIQYVEEKFAKRKDFSGRYFLACTNFTDIKEIVAKHDEMKIQGILFDLGLSSAQLENEERGFSFQTHGSLDMRFSPEMKTTAWDIVNTWKEKDIAEILRSFGEERFAKQIAKKIIEIRSSQTIDTPHMLVEVVSQVYSSVPFKFGLLARRKAPSQKIFQALRIAVNDEINNLIAVLPQALEVLEPGGRMAIITFHSLEDRIVKRFFKEESRDCVCPKSIPICQCGHKSKMKIITKKPLSPTQKEVLANGRARSAKLRVAEKIIS